MRASCIGLIVTGLLLAAPAMAIAQSYQGGLRGAVRDADGVIPGAGVVLVNDETTLERTVVTNAAGEYAFPNLAPGNYTVRVSVQGFKRFESRALRIGTQDFLTLDVTLQVG